MIGVRCKARQNFGALEGKSLKSCGICFVVLSGIFSQIMPNAEAKGNVCLGNGLFDLSQLLNFENGLAAVAVNVDAGLEILGKHFDIIADGQLNQTAHRTRHASKSLVIN